METYTPMHQSESTAPSYTDIPSLEKANFAPMALHRGAIVFDLLFSYLSLRLVRFLERIIAQEVLGGKKKAEEANCNT